MGFGPIQPTIFASKSCASVHLQRFTSSERVTSEEPSCPIYTTMYMYKSRQRISIKYTYSFVKVSYIHKAGSSGRLTVSHSHPHHISFLFFSHPLRFQQQSAVFRLQSISISFLSPSQHHYFRIYFLDNKIEKIII
jgi:hypothetical protein